MGQSNAKPDSEVVDGDNHDGKEVSSNKERPTLGERRQSFYETVDASEVLPYLIIG